jgi:hypothetical protein
MATPNGPFSPYSLDHDSAAAESSPSVIAPDTNPGNKRWILMDGRFRNINLLGYLEVDGNASIDGTFHATGAATMSSTLGVTGDGTFEANLRARDHLHVAGTASLDGNIITGADGYINWGTTEGTSGYGFFDDSGQIQGKDSGGSWWNLIVWEETESGAADIPPTEGLYLLPDTSPYTGTTLTTGDGTADAVVDGVTDTWAINNGWSLHESWGIDLGSQKAVSKLTVYGTSTAGVSETWFGAGNDSMSVYYSNDNATWILEEQFDGPTILDSGAGSQNWVKWDLVFSGGARTARYFKIVCVDANISVSTGSTLRMGEIEATGPGNSYATYDQHVVMTSGKKLLLDGSDSGDTYITESAADTIDIYAGGVQMITLVEGATDEVVINEAGADVNFRVETSARTNAFVIDGGSDFVQTNCDTYLDAVSGLVYIGAQDTVRGYLTLRGHAAGNVAGGLIDLETAADYDATINLFRIQVQQDDLFIGPDTDTSIFGINNSSLIVFNEAGNDVDVRMETSKHSQGFLLDGGNGHIWTINNQDTVYPGTWTGGNDHYTPQAYDQLIISNESEVGDMINIFFRSNIGPSLGIGSGRFGMIKITNYAGQFYFALRDNAAMNTVMTIDRKAVVTIGAEDAIDGSIVLYGDATGSTVGGAISLQLAADHDATIASYDISVSSDDLLIGPNTDTDALKLDSNKDLYLTDGDLYIQEVGTTFFSVQQGGGIPALYLGKDDVERGNIHIYGHAAGQALGGGLVLYTSADHDAVIDYYVVTAYQDDLWIGPPADLDALKLDSNKDFYVTDGDVYFRNPSDDSVKVYVGQDGNHRGRVYIYGENAGSTTGGSVAVYVADDYDAVISYYQLFAYEDDLYIGPATDTDALKYDGGNNLWDFTAWIKNTYTVWEDFRINASAVALAGASVPSWSTFKNGVDALWFSNSAMNEVAFSIHMPHNWKEQSNFKPHVHWAVPSNAATADRCVWRLEYTIANLSGTYGATTNVSGYVSRDNDEAGPGLRAYKHYVTEFNNSIDLSAIDVDAVLLCRLYRDVVGSTLDNLAQDAAFIEFDCHYRIDAFGSDAQFTKS